MPQSTPPSQRSKPAKHILHPTDFTKQSDLALAHALRLALSNRADLHLFHVSKDDDDWDGFPSIRQLLKSWDLIAHDASESDVAELGIGIEKLIGVESSVAGSIEGYCQRHPIDLIVMATAGRHGLAAWLKPSTAEKVAERAASISIPTLFVPDQCRGCVAPDSGEVTMDHVLVPVDHTPDCDSAFERGLRAIETFGGDQSDLTLLHVGSESRFPDVNLPEGPWRINRVVRKGNAAAEILSAADACQASLIIMVTEGTHGILDVVRGTTTEQVLRQAPCPVLAVPANG
ncbi:universal stress protein [Novipirellula artificiosorum]|uniref:Universal stress protein UspE n=1 Tax=Novipirellula artificiosorum TaxID=2528016 RepID=A0A5C6D4W0_9BACT|nr:universal stress protein [Novipirellula artificiosorum]TWU31808.1 universal stress protein UspE [Novipirellula artificiosorum]